MPFNNMLGECNTTIVEEFYANTLAFGTGDYRSYVRGVHVSFAPDVLDATFGFRPEGNCGVRTRRASWREGLLQTSSTIRSGKPWRCQARTGATPPRERVRGYRL